MSTMKEKVRILQDKVDLLPPLDDEDAFFEAATTEEQAQYLYIALKKALEVYYAQQTVITELISQVQELRGKIK